MGEGDRRAVPGLGTRPGFSVVVTVDRVDPEGLRRTLGSIADQTFDCCRVIVALDARHRPVIDEVLDTIGPGPPVTVVAMTAGPEEETADPLSIAGGDHCVLLAAGDVLSIHALGAFAAELGRFDDVDLAYSDEDRLDPATGHRHDPFYKPAFSMERLRCQMYLGRPLVVRTATALEVGGLTAVGRAAYHDLALRVAERARRVLHLPRLLGHLPDGGASAWSESAAIDTDHVRAVADHLLRTGVPARAVPLADAPGLVHLEPDLTDHPPVSVILPTGGGRRPLLGVDTLLIEQAVAGLVRRSTYPDLELVVVVSHGTDPAVVESVAAAAGDVPLTVVADNRPFNFARACNLGAIRSGGDILVFLNDDTEIVTADWLQRLVMYAARPDVGAVGAKLLYGDGRIQHAGVWSRAGGPAHRYAGFAGDHPGTAQSLRVAQNCLAVTAACLAVERTKFRQVGGFSLLYPLAYNDVDLCLKLHRLGFRNVVDCATEVVHHESSSRDPTVRQWEFDRLFRRWRLLLTADPYDNPCNLAAGVDEYPPAPIDVVETKAYRDHDLVLTGRTMTVGPTPITGSLSAPVVRADPDRDQPAHRHRSVHP